MSAKDGTGLPETIARLESIVLESVLQRQPLPGLSEPTWFPDLAWITKAPTVLVSDENVPGALSVTEADQKIEVMQDSSIRDAAAKSGDRAYVRFQPAEQTGGRIRIVMEVRIAPAEPDIKPLGLGGISATFVETNEGEWTVSEPPTIFGI